MSIIKSTNFTQLNENVCFDNLSKHVGYTVDPISYTKGVLALYKEEVGTDRLPRATISLDLSNSKVVMLSADDLRLLEGTIPVLKVAECDEDLEVSKVVLSLCNVHPDSFILGALMTKVKL